MNPFLRLVLLLTVLAIDGNGKSAIGCLADLQEKFRNNQENAIEEITKRRILMKNTRDIISNAKRSSSSSGKPLDWEIRGMESFEKELSASINQDYSEIVLLYNLNSAYSNADVLRAMEITDFVEPSLEKIVEDNEKKLEDLKKRYSELEARFQEFKYVAVVLSPYTVAGRTNTIPDDIVKELISVLTSSSEIPFFSTGKLSAIAEFFNLKLFELWLELSNIVLEKSSPTVRIRRTFKRSKFIIDRLSVRDETKMNAHLRLEKLCTNAENILENMIQIKEAGNTETMKSTEDINHCLLVLDKLNKFTVPSEETRKTCSETFISAVVTVKEVEKKTSILNSEGSKIDEYFTESKRLMNIVKDEGYTRVNEIVKDEKEVNFSSSLRH
ncbi:signal peptide-containing protein [Theileria equi strain WA]|uniref:Signal peptide-containing protein n=1 Tax=Theileria equi strain WA TaxID=1537102 RepID=L0AXN8_THEEQ|nr:signal peptide-containing protein [Theileria equi strain WA]AFZ80013.1 signal peptide-containing protein [Theileria equi strain WA]|eukprot:XP_004829679.1 signal peptide-containing protein [Theileria equi strain WA]